MASERTPWLTGAASALIAGLLLRLWFFGHPPTPAGDALIYSSIAHNLLVHGVYGFNQHLSPAGQPVIEPTLIRLPGYPLFLALVYRIFGLDRLGVVLVLQILADLAGCLLVAALAGRLLGKRAALWVLWIGCLCPFTANYTADAITETLVLFNISLAFYSLWRWMERGGGFNVWLACITGALAWSVTLRPEQGLLAAAVVPVMLWSELRPNRSSTLPKRGIGNAIAPVLVCSVCIVLPLVPWTMRNWRTFHVIQPLAPRSATDPGEPPSPGFNAWYRTWGLDFTTTDTVYWNIDGDPIDPADLPDRAFALGCTAPSGVARQQLPFYAETVSILADYNRTNFDPPALDKRFADLARRRAASEPVCNLLLLPVGRLVNMLLRPRLELLPFPDEWWKAPTPLIQRLFAVAYAGLNLAYLALGAFGLMRWIRSLRPAGVRMGERKSSSERNPAEQRSPEPQVQSNRPGTPGDMPSARLLLAATVAMVLLRAALLLTLDNSEPRYTLEFFPVLFLWSGKLFSQRRQPGPDRRESKESSPIRH